MKNIFTLVAFTTLFSAPAFAGREEACQRKHSCFMALDGPERGMCESYVEGKSCFMALDGDDRGWCQVLNEGKSCFMSLDGHARDRCERGDFPEVHLYWQSCGQN
jgi:hypothetical protein